MDWDIQTGGEDSAFLLDRAGDPTHYWKWMKMDKRTRYIFMKCCMLKIIKISSVFQKWWWEIRNLSCLIFSSILFCILFFLAYSLEK